MMLIADVFLEILDPKNTVGQMTQKPRFRRPLDTQHRKWVKTLSILVIHRILRLFVNTLTVNDKDYLLNRENLTQPVQMQLSPKIKTFSEFFLLNFYNLYSILNICQKKMTLIADLLLQIPAPKNMFR